MAKKVIEVRKVSKKYEICHEQQSHYGTIVETLSRKAGKYFKKLTQPFNPNVTISDTKYEEFWALKDIDLDIEEGDRVGIIGRNGAGKSTLLKVLSRITQPTHGQIKIRGRVSSLLEVGTGFHPELTGRENIYLNGAILGMRKQEINRKFDEIVNFAEIERFLDTPVKRFSSGMHTRLGFAIAAHLDADLLIVDEVLAVGDTQFQEKCLKKLNDLSSHGRTVLFVSHDVGSILTLCNKGVFLEKGTVKEYGPVEQCINTYIRTCRFHTQFWEGNEGDEHTRFYRASLQSDQGVREFFYQGEKARLEIEYEVLKPIPDMVLGISVWNQRSQILARSHTADDVENHHIFTKPGKHKAVFNLDAGLFHEGEYAIKLDCFIHNRKRILNDEIMLKFPVFAQQKNTRFTHSNDREGIFLGNKWSLN